MNCEFNHRMFRISFASRFIDYCEEHNAGKKPYPIISCTTKDAFDRMTLEFKLLLGEDNDVVILPEDAVKAKLIQLGITGRKQHRIFKVS